MADLADLLVPYGRMWTVDDLDGLPDAAFYEIVDGALVVSPPPVVLHQAVASELLHLLANAAPDDLAVLAPGIGYGMTVRIPDVLVMRREAVKRRDKLAAPGDVLLAVEVLSPSSRTTDRITNRHEYAEQGISSYWIIDADEPSLIAMSGPAYAMVETVRGSDLFATDSPFPIRFAPTDLLP